MKKTEPKRKRDSFTEPRGMYGSMHSDVFEGFGLRKMRETLRANTQKTIRSNRRKNEGGRVAARAVSADGSISIGFIGGFSGLGGFEKRLAPGRKGTGYVSEGAQRNYSGRTKSRTVKQGLSLQALEKVFSIRNILLILCASLVISAAVILMTFNFKKSVVYGNTKYSQKQIESFITRGKLGENTFVMALKYHQRAVKDIPFIDRIDIDIVNPSTVKVNITEKPLDGYVDCDAYKVYFSKEGIIQAVSGRSDENAAKINGLQIGKPETGARIKAENETGMDNVLKLLDAMDRYDLHADEINVDETGSLTAGFGDVIVGVGKSGYDRKMYKVHQISKYFDGRSGYISMIGSDYSGENIVMSSKESALAMGSGEETEGNGLREGGSGDPGSSEESAGAAKNERDDEDDPDDDDPDENDLDEDDPEDDEDKEDVEDKEDEDALAEDDDIDENGDSAEKDKEEGAEKTTEKSTVKTTVKPVEKAADKPAETNAETTVEAAEKTTVKTTKTAEKAAEKTTAKTTEAAEKATEKTTEKTTAKPETARKTLKKVVQ